VIAVGAGVLVGLAVLLVGLPWAVSRRGRRLCRATPQPGRGARTGAAAEPGAGRFAPWRVVPRAGPRPGPGGGTRARGRPDVLDPAFVLDLCAAAVRGGAAVPGALVVTGRHLHGAEGIALVQVGTALGLGAPWDQAWAGVPPSVAALGRALGPCQVTGASPGPQLRAAAARVRRERRARVRAAAGALGVRLTLPLGVCFLPAFVLLGLVPAVLGLAGDLLGAA